MKLGSQIMKCPQCKHRLKPTNLNDWIISNDPSEKVPWYKFQHEDYQCPSCKTVSIVQINYHKFLVATLIGGGCSLSIKLLIASEYPHIAGSIFYKEWGEDFRMLIFMVFFLIGAHFSSTLVIKNKSP